jgi:predicted Zn-dependent protease
MDNEVEFKYTKIAMDAIDAWENNFDRLSYKIYTLPPDEYDIRITIHKMYGNAVGLPKETIAFTTNEKGGNGELIHAAIDLSVYYRNTYGSISSVSDRVFYNMVLHEFGHAIGLGHAIDNGKEPVDPMHHSLLINEDKRQVSKLDVLTLKSLYK